MKKIITDTNVWYNITSEEFEKINTLNYKLSIPIIVLKELHTSPNVHLNQISYNAVKNAIKNILIYEQDVDFINLDPFEYLLKRIMPEYDTSNLIEYYVKEFKSFVQLKYEDVKINYQVRPDISGFTNFINE